MGANNFDPFGFYNRQRRAEEIISALRRNQARADDADTAFDGFADDLRILQHLQQQAAVRRAYDILTNKRPAPPSQPKPTQDEASCQPQDKTKKTKP